MGNVHAVCASVWATIDYTVISAPNAGGKVNLNLGALGTDPTLAGQFSYLPYATPCWIPPRPSSFKILGPPRRSSCRPWRASPCWGGRLAIVQLLYRAPVLNNLLAPSSAARR